MQILPGFQELLLDQFRPAATLGKLGLAGRRGLQADPARPELALKTPAKFIDTPLVGSRLALAAGCARQQFDFERPVD